jgi:uncharacterized NAD-dependent epimerase/dehydratase family protein
MQQQSRQMSSIDLPRPYLLFLGDASDSAFAKTALGLRDWAPEACLGEFASDLHATVGLSKLTPAEARMRGARAVVIGVANVGGIVRDEWLPSLIESLEAGLDIISGLHGKLGDIPALSEAAHRHGRRLIDVRTPPTGIPIATGRKRSGKRLLTVGTDCALGKKYTALCLTRALRARSIAADFRATGQTGILISGAGIPMDAVISDFVAGAAEALTPDAAADHWDVIEGQGSVFHPSYAGVSLGLLHGSQPDVIVMCHMVGRDRVLGLEAFATPDLKEAIALTLTLARRTNPQVRCAGISLNTARLNESEARVALANCSAGLSLPVADPMRPGVEFDRLVEACLG